MALFVHFTSERDVKEIRRNGVKAKRRWDGQAGSVFATPVTPDFYRTHQWLREIRRNGPGLVYAVYFRIPDDEPVEVGHYNGPRQQVTVAQAAAAFSTASNALGWEVRIARAITSKEVQAVRVLRQVVGWRYSPDAHERSFCGCVVCVPSGSIRARQKNRRWEASFR